MNQKSMQMITKLMFRLLPVQVLLAAVGSVNGIVSGFFAANYVGIDAMSAVSLYGPVSMFLGAVGTMIAGGSAVISGKYLGQNRTDKLQDVFSFDLLLSVGISLLFTVLFTLMGIFRLTNFFTSDPVLCPVFSRYLIGQAVGILPMILANQLPAFLTMENKSRRTFTASLVYIAVNLILNFVFVQMLSMQETGLALASSLGMWVFFAVQAQYFFSGRSHLKMRLGRFMKEECLEIFAVGLPGATTYMYMTVRGLAVNRMIEAACGSVGLSAFAAANNLLGFFWAIPGGMQAVSRLLISVSVGEEDRQTLTDIMRVMFFRYLPLMGAVIVMIIAGAPLLTQLYFHDPSSDVYRMMTDGLRILPLCMPFAIIAAHFVVYRQAAGQQKFVHIMSILDGMACVILFTALLIKPLGLNAVYIANVLNGVVTVLYVILYAWHANRHFPRNMEELMVIPEDFGAPEEDRIDISVTTQKEVVTVAENIQNFCIKKGIDEKRAYIAGLAMEEMAGNVVSHGFVKDSKRHSIDTRIVYKDGKIILRIRDDCLPFNPRERAEVLDENDPVKNIGIRMIYKMTDEIDYQNLLGLNVPSIRV